MLFLSEYSKDNVLIKRQAVPRQHTKLMICPDKAEGKTKERSEVKKVKNKITYMQANPSAQHTEAKLRVSLVKGIMSEDLFD